MRKWLTFVMVGAAVTAAYYCGRAAQPPPLVSPVAASPGRVGPMICPAVTSGAIDRDALAELIRQTIKEQLPAGNPPSAFQPVANAEVAPSPELARKRDEALGEIDRAIGRGTWTVADRDQLGKQMDELDEQGVADAMKRLLTAINAQKLRVETNPGPLF